MNTNPSNNRTVLARAMVAAAVICVSVPAAPARAQVIRDSTTTSTFGKQAVAIRPGGAVPAFGQVMVGQRIDYVLTAMTQVPAGAAATGIVDVLSPNQAYVPGSLRLPPGWTAAPTPPYSANNTTVYSAPAGAAPLSFQLPVGGSAVSVSSTGMGDGMYPIPVANGRIYAVYHHLDSNGRIDCWIATTLARCPGFPRPISAGDSVGTLWNFNGAVVQGRYIYYAAFQRYTRFAGLACWDTAVEAECPFQPVGTAPVAVNATFSYAASQIAGALVVPGTSRVLIAVTNRLYCFDKGGGPASSAPCAGWPAAGVTTGPVPAPAQTAHFMDLAFEIGANPARVYVSMGTGGNQDGVQCVTLATAAICNGWSASPQPAIDPQPDPYYAKYGMDLHPIPGPSGGHGSVCLFAIDGRPLRMVSNPAAPACWDPGATPAAPGFPGFPPCAPNPAPPNQACLAFASMSLGSGAGASRVIFARWNGGPLCLDMASGAGAPCAGFNSGALGGFSFRDYGFAPDPLAPARCVLALGDAGRLYRFDGRTGQAGCPVTYQTTGDPMDFFCRKKPTQLAWSQIVIKGRPKSPALTGGTIVVRNPVSQAVLLTLPVTTSDVYPIASIPYAANHTLTIEFTPVYAQSDTAVAPYALEVQFTANEAPQICYQARVERCGEISNIARSGPLGSSASGSAVPAVLPSAYTASASVFLGDALAAPCDSCPPHRDSLDVSIRKSAFYPPWTVGTMGEFQMVTTVEQGTLDPATAPTPTFTDSLPTGLTFHSFTGAPEWECVATGPRVACIYRGPPVAAGNPLPPVTLAVNVVGPAAGGAVVNCAVLSPDANPENNRGCVDAVIRPCGVAYDLAIQKETVGGAWKVGTTRQFVVRTTVAHGTFNPATAAAPTWVDSLPAGVTFVSATTTATGWACSAAGQQVTCTYQGAPLAAGQQLPPVTLAVSPTRGGPIQNCAVLAAIDLNSGNNRSCVNVDVGS